jgi:hypothetical protein
MSDVLHDVLTKLSAMDTKIGNLVERSDEDRKDAGRHRENQRVQFSGLHDEMRSMNYRVTRIEPIVEYLDKQSQRKKIVREFLPRFGRTAWYLLSVFFAAVVSWFGAFEKVRQFFAGLMH